MLWRRVELDLGGDGIDEFEEIAERMEAVRGADDLRAPAEKLAGVPVSKH